MDQSKRPLVPASPMPVPVAPATIDDDFIKSRILTIRGMQVMLDRDLAMLYGVEAKRINEQVKRNAERFPDDFMFRLTKEECLRSQIATLNTERSCITSGRPSRTSDVNTAPSPEWTRCSFRPFCKGSNRTARSASDNVLGGRGDAASAEDLKG